jgi:hypothetical protein
MGYLVPPPPPQLFRFNAGYAGIENQKWLFEEKKPKTVDELLEEAANYDPLAEIKAGRLSLIQNKRTTNNTGPK